MVVSFQTIFVLFQIRIRLKKVVILERHSELNNIIV